MVAAATCPASQPGGRRSGSKLADIFRRFGPGYLRRHTMSPQQAKALRAVGVCRTPALGGHVYRCTHCDYEQPTYNSCRNRHCPICQGAQAIRWLKKRTERLVPTHYFHTVFTLPAELRALALANQRVVFDLMFSATQQTLLELARGRWEALPALTCVLHTWTRKMDFHPHIHCIISGGGLSLSGERWVPGPTKFLFPVKVLSALFRGKFMAGLIRAYEKGQLHFTGGCADLADPEQFAALRRRLYRASWVTYAKRPFGGPRAVMRYLSRYTHRVAIAPSRIISFDEQRVVFKTRGGRKCRLSGDEFIRRFLLHVLPVRYRKIRHSGLLAPSHVSTRLVVAQRLAGELVAPDWPEDPRVEDAASGDTVERGERACPACGVGILVATALPSIRGPPRSLCGGGP